MLSAREAAYGLTGAARLAFYDASSLRYFDLSPRGAARSFWAAALALPLSLLLSALLDTDTAKVPLLLARIIVWSLMYVIQITGFALIMRPVTRWGHCEGRYAAFVCVYNWINVISMILTLPYAVFMAGGALTEEQALLPASVVFFVLEAYLAFATWATLRSSWHTILGVVSLEYLYGFLLSLIATGTLTPLAPG